MGTRRRGRPAAEEVTAGPHPGTLYVVGTPIGNLEDLSPRAAATLSTCALVACEDTRVTRGLLERYGIAVPVLSYHRHNERQRVGRILDLLASGGDVALVCDGGTPGLSDPGAVLVRAARAAGRRVVPIPGPSAPSTLWSVSGFEPGPFLFVGFLPQKSGARRKTLLGLASERHPLLLFESPHRILDTLDDARVILGDRQAFLGREMTKMYEEFLHGTLGELRALLQKRPIRGEFTLLVSRSDRPVLGVDEVTLSGPDASLSPAAEVARLLASGATRGEAFRQVSRRRGMSRRDLYREVLREREAEKEGFEAPEGHAPGEEE
ncbi:MAG TPA: 16S rRNA (cytidine(1402)-2'-O)-methyltransferase [Candidatus Cryosericum sp.]|nr:16S rRNA (cytidine(1402)-2'-O)-methyltransferase [Candidatus Cryosericum sp.]